MSQPQTVHQLDSDRPRTSIADDRLGFEAFARAVARSLHGLAPVDGFVAAIHGAWGSGKTSAVNMTLEALEQLGGEPTLIVRFNPWWFSGQENLIGAFFSEVTASLSGRISESVVDGFKAVARKSGAAKELLGAGLSLLPGGAVLKLLADAGIGLAVDWADDELSLDERRQKLRDALKNEGKRILVVIDDVDRLPADEARQIFRLVKSVADLPNVVYLLVFDREIARRALAQEADASGPEWLEKIVQASFDLPPPHERDLQDLFLQQLSQIVGNSPPIDPGRWPDVFHKAVAPWLRTPRDAARLSNAVAVVWPVVSDEVDLGDLVAIETLRLFEPKIYDLIRCNPSEVTGLRSEGLGRHESPEFAESLLAATPRGVIVKRALTTLFPRLQGVWSNHGYASGFLDIWDRARRVCSARRFAVSDLRAEHGREDEAEGVPEADRLVDASELVRIEEAIKRRFAADAASGALLNRPDLTTLLHRWLTHADEGVVRTWTAKQVETDAGALALAAAATRITKSQAFDSYALVESPNVHRDSLSKIVDVDRLVVRLDEIFDGEGRDGSSKRLVERFREGLAARN